MSPDIASAVIRSLAFALLFQSAGSVIFLTLFGNAASRSVGTIRRLSLVTALLGVAALAIHLLLDAARLTGEYAGVLDPGMQRLALGTVGAISRLLQMAGLLIVAFGMWTPSIGGRRVGLGGALVTVAAFLLAGHTAVHAWRIALAPLLLLHLVVVAIWFGSLIPLCVVLRLEVPNTAADVLARFSRWAVGAVPLLAVAGVVLALAIAGGVPNVGEPYGALLLAKVVAFLVLMGLAGLNKLRLVPAVRNGQGSASRALQLSIAVEAAIMVAVLATTAVLTSFFSP